MRGDSVSVSVEAEAAPDAATIVRMKAVELQVELKKRESDY